MIRRPPRSTLDRSSAASDVYKRQVIVAHEDHKIGGLGGEITSIIMQNCFNVLDAPVLVAASKNTPVGFSHIYEKAILINSEDIYNTAKEVFNF